MVAVNSNSNITFKNVGGAMKLSFKGSHRISYMMLSGNKAERISGQAKVTASVDAVPEVTMLEYATNYIFLGCWNEEGAGVQLNQDKATEFIISLPPVTFEKGFTLHVTDTNGATTQIKSDKLNTVLRSSILVMPEINVDEYEWVMPKTPIQLNTVLSAVSNVQNGTNSVTLNLATYGVSCYIDPNTFTYVYEGTGNYLALDLYSADGYLHEGVYYPSSTGGTINEGEFAIGWDPGDIYGIGYSFENWGTCWWNVGDSGATINRKITDGYVVVSRDGDNWKIELICGENESMLWVQYNGPIEQLTQSVVVENCLLTDTTGDVFDWSSFVTVEGLTSHTVTFTNNGELVASFVLITEAGADIEGTYYSQEYPMQPGLMDNGYDLLEFGIGGSYYNLEGQTVLIPVGETVVVTKSFDGVYTFECSTGVTFTGKFETVIPSDIELTQLLTMIVNYEYDENWQPTYKYTSLTLEFATDGITVETVTSEWGSSVAVGGNGHTLTVDFYTVDGTLAPGVYHASETAGTVLEDEFGIGYDVTSTIVWGTRVTPYTDGIAGEIIKVTDGTITVEQSGDIYTMYVDTSVIKAKYVGPLTL